MTTPKPAATHRSPAADRPPPDLRLAGMALGTWLSALAALYLSARTGALLAAGAAALATLLLLTRRPPSSRRETHRRVDRGRTASRTGRATAGRGRGAGPHSGRRR